MNISHYPCDSNRAKLLAIQGTNQSKYLEPDYFLPSNQSDSYYSRKYSGNHTTSGSIGIKSIYQSKRGKISRAASVIMLSLSFLATAVEVKAQPNTVSSTISLDTIVPNPSFLFGNGSAGISINVPTPPKMPQSPLAAPFNSATTPPAPPPPVPPTPPVLPAMPDLISDTSGGAKPDNRSAFLESIRNFGKVLATEVK